MGGYLACMGVKGKVYRILVGKPERKMPLAIPRLYGRKFQSLSKIRLNTFDGIFLSDHREIRLAVTDAEIKLIVPTNGEKWWTT